MAQRIARWTRTGENTRRSTGPRSRGSCPRTATQVVPGVLPRLLDARGELLDEVVDRAVLLDQPRDLGGGVDDRGVVAPAELLPDHRKRGVGELAAEVHRDLARIDDRLGRAVAGELLERDAEALDD